MKQILLALTLLTTFVSSAQIVNIPDANFKNALLNHNPVIDTNGDGEIQLSEAAVVSDMYVGQKNITDMSGIEAFVNLELLRCDSNNLTIINISDNLQLEVLDCNSNNLTELDVTTNINLKDLYCFSNNLASIDISNNLNLERLEISDNQFSSIDITNNLNLIEFRCQYNNLTSLDISNNLNLRHIQFGRNFISTIDISQNINLLEVRGQYNNLTSLDTSNNLLLETLEIGRNSISAIDLSANINLTAFAIVESQLTSLDISSNVNLEYLLFASNPISEIDVSGLNNLEEINFSSTLLSEIDLTQNPSICRIAGDDNFHLEYVNLKNGNNEVLGGCTYSYLSLLNNPNLQFICVEDAQYAAANFTDIPPLATFVEDCSIANGDLNHITGTLNYDDENNGCDGGDAGIGGLLVNTTDGTNNFAATTISAGNYNLTVAENTYSTTVLGLPPYFTLSPAQEVDTFVGFNQTEVADFCIAPATTANDLAVTFVPLIAARPGFEARYKLVYENVGTTQLSGNVELNFDGGLVTFVEATPTETSINGNTISWDYSNLNPFETRSIEVIFEVAQPPIVEQGDVVPYTATVNPVSGDAEPDDNVFTLNQVAVNSFDPNDKQVLEGRQVLIEDADNYLHYVVRFQNMGTASAINVRVQDALDEKLDWTTLKVLDESHAMETQLVNGQIDFIFDDINLPTQNSDPEGSKGFVSFKVKPLPTIQLNDTIFNTADIYFDFNAAIVTNTVFTKFVDELGISDFETLKVVAYPNPANNILNIQAEAPISSITITNVLGQQLFSSKAKSNKEQLDISGLAAGNYFVKVTVGQESKILRVVKQ